MPVVYHSVTSRGFRPFYSRYRLLAYRHLIMDEHFMQVQIIGNASPTIMESFSSCGFHNILLKNISSCKLFKPTPIQKYVLPILMAGRDLMASAPTGCGITVAYCLPILHYLMCQKSQFIIDEKHCEPRVIVMAPTNEFVVEICDYLSKFYVGTHIRFGYLNEGIDVICQRSDILMNGYHILVATPGSLKDFVDNNLVSLKSVKILVLDKADTMLDMGFRSDIEQLLNHPTMTSNDLRQTLMCSTTSASEMKDTATSYLKPNYVFVTMKDVRSTEDIEQTIRKINKFNKKMALVYLLKEMEDGENAIVFVKGKRFADFIATFLSEMDIPTTSIHENRDQPEREEVLRDFKTNKMKVLVGTSVLTDELALTDIKDVNYVVNYHLPKTIDEYIYRIKCFGILGTVGKAISFFDPGCDGPIASELIRFLKQVKQEIPLWLCIISSAENFKFKSSSDDFKKFRKSRPNIFEDENGSL